MVSLPPPPPHLYPHTFSHPSTTPGPSSTTIKTTTTTTGIINRTDNTMPPPSFLPRKRKIAPALTSPSPSMSGSPTPDAEDADDDDYAPVTTIAGPSKRTTKASSSSTTTMNHSNSTTKGGSGGVTTSGGRTMSREQLRKANHSMIERRRREKINAALGELRDMVPGLGGETKGGEFKLEVLEQTVQYMKELKQRIEELESAVITPTMVSDKETNTSTNTSTSTSKTAGTTPMTEKRSTKMTKSHTIIRKHETVVDTTDNFSSPDIPLTKGRLPAIPTFPLPFKSKSSTTPPSPSLSPDPNETEPEMNLPPAYTLSARHTSTPSITSLLQSANSDYRPPTSRPIPGPQATNPTLYLPFPTPSPTSPFLTYNNTSSSSSGSSGPPEPSPFIAPLHSMPLFGGALNLDQPDLGSKKDLKAEEAANLLLAFSSPDTLHPINGLGMGTGLTPKMVPVNTGLSGGKRERRGTLESDEFEFVLDGGVRDSMGRAANAAGGPGRNGVVGKTARDILKM